MDILFKVISIFTFPQQVSPPTDDALAPYRNRMETLGMFRCEVMVCTATDNPKGKHYFNPPPEANLAEEFHTHLQRMWERYLPEATGDQYNGMAVIAAGLLTFGHLEMVDYIFTNLPPHRIVLDHGCGWCNLLAFRIAARLLPLPEELRNYSSWVKGNCEAEQVRVWFEEYRSRLVWNVDNEQFIMSR